MPDEAQLSIDDLAAQARARASDPWTSHAAARSITEDQLRASQKAVLDAFRQNGAMHHEQLVGLYDRQHHVFGWPMQSPSGLRTRTKELRDAGFIEDTGRTVLLPSRRHSKVWQAVA
jgi:hypothetical protein